MVVVLVVEGIEVIVSVVVVLVVGAEGVVVTIGGAVPKLGVATQVETCRPCTSDLMPSGCRVSLNPAGRLPTNLSVKSVIHHVKCRRYETR